jgi:hypothetical protein
VVLALVCPQGIQAGEVERRRALVAENNKALAERQAERELGLRLIAIGSRTLMKEAHPKLASSKRPWQCPLDTAITLELFHSQSQ